TTTAVAASAFSRDSSDSGRNRDHRASRLTRRSTARSSVDRSPPWTTMWASVPMTWQRCSEMPWCSDTPTSLQLARERTTTSRRGGTVTGATGRTTTPSSTATPGGTAVAATGGATRCWTFTVDAAGPASDDAAPPSTATIAKVAVDAAPAIATRDAAAGCRRLLRTTRLCRSVIVVPSLVPVVIVGLAVLRAVVRPIVVVRPVVVVRIVVVRPAGLVGGRVGARH